MGYANFLSLTLVSKTKFSGDLLAVFMKWLCLVTPGAAEKRATVNTTISDAVFTELLEYYIKVYSKTPYFLKNIKGDLHPCANTSCFPSWGVTCALKLWRFLLESSASVGQYFVGDGHKLCPTKSHKSTNSDLISQVISPFLWIWCD